MTLGELVLILLLQEKISNATRNHVNALLYIIGQKNEYLSLDEMGESTLIKAKDLRKIMQALAKKRLVQKEGCLYRKPESEKIAEIIECR